MFVVSKNYSSSKNLFVKKAHPIEFRRFKNRVSSNQKKALRFLSEVFNNHCSHPWFVIGSISFLINAKHSQKQPEDIDIIFHEEDFFFVKENLELLGFVEGFSKETSCKFLSGFLVCGNKKIGVEAFAQSTKKPNGIINPGAKNSFSYVKQVSVEDQSFLVICKREQTELYFKSMALELEGFNLNYLIKTFRGDEFELKSKKFINRLVNLFELYDYDANVMFADLKYFARSNKQKIMLKKFIVLSNDFKKKRLVKSDKDDLQVEIEKLKKIIGVEIRKIINDYIFIQKYSRGGVLLSSFGSKLFKSKFKNDFCWFERSIKKRKVDLEVLLNIYLEDNVHEERDLPLYIFIKIFEENIMLPFFKKLDVFIKK